MLSPRDAPYEKQDFYLRVGVEELLFVDPTTKAFEVRRPDGDGWIVVSAEPDGWTTLASLGVALRTRDGTLEIRTDDGSKRSSQELATRRGTKPLAVRGR